MGQTDGEELTKAGVGIGCSRWVWRAQNATETPQSQWQWNSSGDEGRKDTESSPRILTIV